MEATSVSFARASTSSLPKTSNPRVVPKSVVTLKKLSPMSMKSHSRSLSICAVSKLATNNASATATTPTTKPAHSPGLIVPDGGVLVDLHVAESEKEQKKAEASTLPRVALSRVDLEWVHTVAEGWASPLKGFMRQNEYLQALHFNCLRLPNGELVNMSLPIVLALDDEKKEELGGVTAVTLVAPNGEDVAILRK